MSVRLELAIGSGVTNGGTIATGMLQLAAGIPLDTTLRAVTDQANTVSPLQLSTTQVGIYYPNGTFNGGLSITGGADGGAGTTSFVDFIPNKSTPTYYHAIGFAYDNSNWLGFYRGSRATAALAFGNDLIWTPSYNVAIGHTSASARLHVRGDGTNPIARFENGAGTTLVTFNQSALGASVAFANAFTLTGNTGTSGFSSTISGNVTGSVGTLSVFDYTMASDLSTSSTSNYFRILKTIAPGAGSANFRNFILEYTINATGAQSGTATGIFLNATETALNGMTHNLMDLQVGGVSKFKVDRLGSIIAYNIDAQGSTSVFNAIRLGISSIAITTPSNGVMTLYNGGTTDFNRLQFGGTTNLFPSWARNGVYLDARLADNSAYTFIRGKLSTDTNVTATGDVACNGYITMYDAAGTAVKVMTTA